MASNRKFEDGRKLSVTCSHPTTPTSGNPCRVGIWVGTALADELSGGTTSVDFGGVYTHSVKGEDDSGNVAVAAGDQLYYVDADIGSGTGTLSKKDSGYPAGIALAAVSSGATTTIDVAMGVHRGAGQATLPQGFLKIALVAGGTAGNHTVTGIATGDELVSVLHASTAASIATVADLTSEFSISAANTINNTGGTDTTNDQLWVFYIDRT